MTPQEAREAARAKMDKAPGKVNEVWGFAIGSLIFLQEGLVGNSPGLIASIKQRGPRLEVVGTAGLNLGGLVLLAPFYGIFLVLSIGLLIGRGDPELIWVALASSALFVGVAWSNHVFRKDADHLVHLLRRALRAVDLVKEDRAHDRNRVPAARLLIDGEEQADSPSPYDLREAVLGLGSYHFLIASFDDEEYMQVLAEDAGYCLEHRQGSPQRHYRASAQMTREKLVAIFEHYLLNRCAPADVEWERVEL